MDFKIIFPAGCHTKSEINDNLDINIVLENGDIYFATLFTLVNVKYLLEKDNEPCFWATDMLIVKDLSRKTIRESIAQTIKAQYIGEAFTKIGRIETQFRNLSFDELPDMANGYDLDLNDE